VRGTTALLMPDLDALLKRLQYAQKYLEGTQFSFREAGDTVETTCPWGNRIRVHSPDPSRFGAMRVGMPYVEFDIPAGTDLGAIAKFYTDIMGGIAGVGSDARGPYAWANTSAESKVIYRETKAALPEYDGSTERPRPRCRNMTGTTSRSRSPTSPAHTRSCSSVG
jgi:hypothetical protein